MKIKDNYKELPGNILTFLTNEKQIETHKFRYVIQILSWL